MRKGRRWRRSITRGFEGRWKQRYCLKKAKVRRERETGIVSVSKDGGWREKRAGKNCQSIEKRKREKTNKAENDETDP